MRCPNPNCPDIAKFGFPGDYRDGITVCPKCGTDLVPVAPEVKVTSQRRIVIGYEKLLWLYSPRSEWELALLKSIFKWAGIRYFVHNNHFGTMRVGPDIDLLNRKTIMVPETQAAEALDLVLNYLNATSERQMPLLARDRIRVVIEFFLFHWFIPGKMKSKRYNDQLVS